MTLATGLPRVLDAMQRHDIDVLLLGREPNARFVTGAARLYLASERAFAPGCVVVRATESVHLLSVGDVGIPRDLPSEHLYSISWNPATLMGEIAAIPGVADARRVGVDGLTPLFEQLIDGYLGAPELVDGERILRATRRVKTDAEVDAIRAAVAVAHPVMAAALAAARANASDATIVAIAMETMAYEHVTTAAFEPVVTRAGDVTAIDIGVLREGWEGGLARTEPSMPAPSEHTQAIARCISGTAVDAIAPDGRVHGVGLGYEVLEPGTHLEANMVVSVAHGFVRDLVLVTGHRPAVLTD
jgi:Xaa-Pro aminopeptidase